MSCVYLCPMQVFLSVVCVQFQKPNLIQGDWRKHHEANKELLYVIEPVIESLIQLLVQSILVYVVLGPSDSIEGIAGPDIPHYLISGL